MYLRTGKSLRRTHSASDLLERTDSPEQLDDSDLTSPDLDTALIFKFPTITDLTNTMPASADSLKTMSNSPNQFVKIIAQSTDIPETPNKKPIFLTNLPTFNGFTSAENGPTWFRKFTDCANVARWTLTERGNNIVSHLDGPALDWFRTLDRPTKSDYAKFVGEFYETFGMGPNSVDSEIKWRALIQEPTETSAHFASRVTRQGFAANKSDQDVLTAFLHGLPQSIKVEVFRRYPKSFKEAVDAAKFAESYIPKESPSLNVISAHMTQEIEQLRTQLLDALNKVDRPSTNQSRNRSGQPICNFCNKVGHAELACRSKAASDSEATNNVSICNYCGRMGHVIQDCRIKMRNQSNPRPQQQPTQYHQQPAQYQQQPARNRNFPPSYQNVQQNRHPATNNYVPQYHHAPPNVNAIDNQQDQSQLQPTASSFYPQQYEDQKNA